MSGESARLAALYPGGVSDDQDKTNAIELRGVVKTFGPITAVDGLDLEVPSGHLPRPARAQRRRQVDDDAAADRPGDRRLGRAAGARARAARARRRPPAPRWASCPQLDNLDVDVTVEDNLAVFARLYRVADVARRGRSRRSTSPACAIAAATRSTSSPAGCAAGCCSPAGSCTSRRLVLLDEPTVGLDPQIRTELWSLIDGLRTSGATILMSTHYIEEAERLADEVAVMAHGKVVARGRPAELIAEHAGRETAEVYGPPDRLAEVRAQAEADGLSVRPAGPGDRDRRRRALERTARCPTTRSAAPPRSRTSSCCSPARRPNEPPGSAPACGGSSRPRSPA